MKPKARESFIKALTKACEEEKIEIEINSLSDKELKGLYLKLQEVNKAPYAIAKEKDFVKDMENNELQFVSFRDTFKYGVRRLTFKEYLLLCEFVKENPSMYKSLNRNRI